MIHFIGNKYSTTPQGFWQKVRVMLFAPVSFAFNCVPSLALNITLFLNTPHTNLLGSIGSRFTSDLKLSSISLFPLSYLSGEGGLGAAWGVTVVVGFSARLDIAIVLNN